MRAIILCAGLGTRLRPLTSHWPKPALPLLGQPLLRYNLAVLRAAGVQEVAINTHHLAEAMAEIAAAECQRVGMRLEVSYEPVIQGTAGGIRGLRSFLTTDPFVVLNGDILFALELGTVIERHRQSGADATMVLQPLPTAERYAAVQMDRSGRVGRIAGHGPGGEQLSPWHFTGVHVLSPRVFEFMTPDGEEDINRTVYPRMMQAGRWVRGEVVRGYWSDVGTPRRYLATQQELLFGQVPWERFADASPLAGCLHDGLVWRAPTAVFEGAGIAGPALLDRGCQVRPGARLGANVYVGPGAQVGAGAHLHRAAVLEGTTIADGEEVVDAIAWGAHRIPAGG
jgi:mannose-1-phosphate guanylyltransferase